MRPRFRCSEAVGPLAVAACLALSLTLALPRPAASQDSIRWEPFTLEVGDVAHEVELGRLWVPEVRVPQVRLPVDAEVGTVELAFVRLPTRAADPGPPIVYLDGGPGGSGYGIARAPSYWPLFDGLRDVAEVILLSQRGTGLSSPNLACPLLAPLPADLFTTRARILEALLPEVEACADTWRGRGVALEGYTTVESSDDLESLRRALGADSLSLLGFSYGTHLGLTVIRRHGDRIHRAVLIGTEGPDDSYKLPSTADLQLRHLSALMAADPVAGAILPDLVAALDTLFRRLDREPLSLEIETRSGPRSIRLGGDGLRYLVRRDLGDTNDHPVWPPAFRMALDGDDRMLTRLAARRFNELAGVPLMGILMDCASGTTAAKRARVAAETPSSRLGAMTNLWFPEVCRAVPEARLDDDFRSRFVSAVPTLFVSGTLDANTPPYQAHRAAWGWPNATHVVVDRAGHEALMPWPPAQRLIVDFFRGVDVRGRTLDPLPLEFQTLEAVQAGLDP